MRVRKAIKKIVALGAGVTMMGATLLGAMAAADLANYPDMFIKDGKFDGYLVVGDNAAAADVVGVTNIAASLQAVSVKTTYVSVGTAAETSVDDGVKIDKTSDHLYLGKDLQDVMSSLDNSDLPDMLDDGTYDESEGNTDNDVTYTQKISFTSGTGTVTYTQDDNDAPEHGWYLHFDDASGKYMYTYTLEFDDAVEYDTTSSTTAKNDLEGTELEMQGNTYTIVKADVDGSNDVDKLSLMAGETVLWLSQGEKVTRVVDGTEHEIEMVDVTEGEDSCGFKVDGSTVWVDVDETETKNGVTIGVLEAKAVHTEKYDADICKVNIGASELVLEDGKEVQMNGKDVDGSSVSITASSGQWTKLEITYVPDDDVYLMPGDEYQDPIFGNFKFVVGNVVQKTEQVMLSASGDDATLTFTNNDGKEVEIPFYYDGSNIVVGDGDAINDRVYFEGDTCQSATATDDVRECEGAMFYVVTSGQEAHLIEITDIDTTDDKIDFKDLTYGSTDEGNSYTDGQQSTITLGSGVGDIKLTINETGNASEAGFITFDDINLGGNNAETEYEAEIAIGTPASDGYAFKLFEESDEAGVPATNVTVNLTYDTNDDEIDVGAPSFDHAKFGPVDDSADNNDDQYYATYRGTEIKYDQEDKRSLDITYPDEPAWLEVFFTPVNAELMSGGSEGEVATQQVQKIAVGAVKLASEVSDVKSVNAVVVGGPCANTAAAELLGNPANCAEGFEEGHAKIKLFENNGKVQILVAGYAAEDTRRASIVLAEYDKYKDYLKGDEVDVTGTSLTDISVGMPMEESE
ncbi:S-layer protein [Candidatus Woesearchaeota archaeon]|nr:MAG: S-layer protein [Candidatus Woesearchaeota archaeon]